MGRCRHRNADDRRRPREAVHRRGAPGSTGRVPVLRRPTLARHLAAFLLAASVSGAPAAARELFSSEDGERDLSLTTALKATSLLPESEAASNLWRLRFILEGRAGERSNFEIAYEQRTRSSPGQTGGLLVLPGERGAPYRIEGLDDALVEEDATFSYRHELDRAFAAFHSPSVGLTLGRQAVGWGRGMFFSAVDVFAPFSPLEVDREWRRGVDAVRLDAKLSDTWSFDATAAGGESWRESALLGRLRGYAGRADAELICGKRREDLMYAGTISAAVGDAALHAELAFFETPERFENGGLFGSDGAVAKAIVGLSNTFDVGTGLTVVAEYHYSGFGFEDIRDGAAALLNPDAVFTRRLLSGDTQMVGRRAAALQLSYSPNDAWAWSLLCVGNPDDGSGVVTPALSWYFSDNVTVLLSAFFPFGREPEGGVPRSEYGGAPVSAFLQISLYN